MKKGIEDLIDGISVYVDSKLKNIYSLNMMTGIITNVSNKKYIVLIDGENYDVTSINNFVSYKKNDVVKILVSKNGSKIREMIIIGKIGDSTISPSPSPSSQCLIYEGATEAGYNGTEKQFGADLYDMLQNGGGRSSHAGNNMDYDLTDSNGINRSTNNIDYNITHSEGAITE